MPMASPALAKLRAVNVPSATLGAVLAVLVKSIVSHVGLSVPLVTGLHRPLHSVEVWHPKSGRAGLAAIFEVRLTVAMLGPARSISACWAW